MSSRWGSIGGRQGKIGVHIIQTSTFPCLVLWMAVLGTEEKKIGRGKKFAALNHSCVPFLDQFSNQGYQKEFLNGDRLFRRHCYPIPTFDRHPLPDRGAAATGAAGVVARSGVGANGMGPQPPTIPTGVDRYGSTVS